jgi:hypothetical protein
VAYWLDHNSVDTLLIGLTDGDLAWEGTNPHERSDMRGRPMAAEGGPGFRHGAS